MEPTTRERILELLQHRPYLTAAEMSRTLRVTRHDIRYHIKFLISQGLVTQMLPTSRPGRSAAGRPAMVYQLSPSARPDSSEKLADILLEMGQKSASPQAFLDEAALRFVPINLIEPAQTHLSQHLNTSIQIINQHPYQARWEAHSTGPQVIFGSCPFSAIIAKHPELCQMDRRIIENLTGLPAQQTKKIDPHSTSSAVCIFKLSQAVQSDK